MAVHLRAVMVSAMAIAAAVVDVVVAAAPASAAPDGAVTVEVLKYTTPEFGVRLAQLVKGAPPNDMDITGPPDGQRDLDGGQASQIFDIRPHGKPSTASASYAVEQNGRLLGTFRVNMNLGLGGDPNALEVTCDEQDSPIDCYAFQNPFIVRVYPKDPARNR